MGKNRHIPPDARIQGIVAEHRTPIMFYRPDKPAGGTYLKLLLPQGQAPRKVAAILQKLFAQGTLRHDGGLVWRDAAQYEHEVALLQRFLVDASISGGGGQTLSCPGVAHHLQQHPCPASAAASSCLVGLYQFMGGFIEC